jgi:hypothetical protein
MAKYELMEKTENNGDVWYYIRKDKGLSVENSWTKKLEEAEKKINELRNCCDDNRKLLVNVQELKGEIEAIKMVAKSEGPSTAVMEMRIRSLRKTY